MFQVFCTSPLDDNWEERDEALYKAAGGKSHSRATSNRSDKKGGIRDHEWRVGTLEEARAMKQRLEEVDLVKVVIREGISNE